MYAPARVLITSGAGPGVAGLIQALRSHPLRTVAIVAGDVEDRPCAGTALADKTCLIPHAAAPQFVPRMLGICARHGIDVLVPVFSGELGLLARARAEFEAIGTAVLVADAQTVNLTNNKAECLASLSACGIPVPRYRRVTSWTGLHEALDALGHPETRVCVKPLQGTGGRGFHIICDDADRYARFFSEKADTTACTLTDLQKALTNSDDIPPELIASEYLSGPEYGADVLAEHGEVRALKIRKKLPPERHGMHFSIRFVANDAVRSLIQSTCSALSLSSLASIDVRCSPEGVPHVLEVNPRPGAYIGMACAEINLIAMAIDSLLEDAPVDTSPYRSGRVLSHGIRCFHDIVFTHDGQKLRGQGLPAEKVLSEEAGLLSLGKGDI